MNDARMNDTRPPLRNAKQPDGSLALGVAIAWAIMIVGEMLALMRKDFDAILSVVMLPPVVVVIVGVVLLASGKPRTGMGVFLGVLSMAAVALLLVAACFGLFALGG